MVTSWGGMLHVLVFTPSVYFGLSLRSSKKLLISPRQHRMHEHICDPGDSTQMTRWKMWY